MWTMQAVFTSFLKKIPIFFFESGFGRAIISTILITLLICAFDCIFSIWIGR